MRDQYNSVFIDRLLLIGMFNDAQFIKSVFAIGISLLHLTFVITFVVLTTTF